MSQPMIGITLDFETAGSFSKYPYYAVRENYCAAVSAAGGVPILLPHEPEQAGRYLDRIDGLLITGGHFDVDPSLFGASSRHSTVTTKDRRTAFEWQMTKGALEQDLPVFGICGGQQLLAVVLGGTLIQHIPDEVEAPLPHEQPNPRHEAGHRVRILEGSRLHAICKTGELPVNSAHHQAVKAVPDRIVINAYAEDGVIEGIEDPARRFCLGVQWHPEFFISEGDKAIFQAFIKAAAA